MPYIKLKTGTRFGRLTVLGRGRTKPCKHITWRCRCVCGKVVEIVSQALRDGRSRSCGCWQREQFATVSKRYWRKTSGDASFNLFVKSVRESARSRNLVIELTPDQIKSLSSRPCIYCGRSNTSVTHGKNMFGAFKHVGIDRVDNSAGYTVANSVPCCADCNRAKGMLSRNAFLAWAEKVRVHLEVNPL